MPDNEKKPDQLETAANLLATETARANAAEQALTAEKTRADQAEGKVVSLTAEVNALRVERTDATKVAEKDAALKELQERCDKAERALVGFADRVTEGVNARAALERKARVVLGDDFRFDGATDRELMAATLDKCGLPVDQTRSDDFLRGAFVNEIDRRQKCGDALARIIAATPTQEQRNDAVLTAKAAREQMIARNRGTHTPSTGA